MSDRSKHKLCASDAPIAQDLAQQWMIHSKKKKNPLETGRVYLEKQISISGYRINKFFLEVIGGPCMGLALLSAIGGFLEPRIRLPFHIGAAVFTLLTSFLGFVY